jgi:hypothetical protein
MTPALSRRGLARALAVLVLSAASAAQTVTWNPDVDALALDPGETAEIVATVCLPGQVAKADIYLLADTTTSMTPVLDSVKANAAVLVDALVNTPGVDLRVGVGNYRDFPFDPKPFDHQVSPTTDANALVAAINTWIATGGGDGSEAQFYALHQIATDPAIGFRPDAKRIVVWFGDSPAHDPICDVFTGFGVPAFEIDEALVTSVLQSQGFGGGTTVIAIGTTSSPSVYPLSLNDDPNKSVFDYWSPDFGVMFCQPAGLAGQADRIAAATSGISTTIVDPGQITATILQTLASVLIAADVGAGASPELLPFVLSIDPPFYDDLALPQNPTEVVCADFTFTLQGPPCGDQQFITAGTLDVSLNGVPLAGKDVTVTQPACFNGPGLLWAGLRRMDPPEVLPGGDPTDLLQVHTNVTVPLPLGQIPVFDIPDEPTFIGFELWFQCALNDPATFPDDPIKVSNGLKVTFGDLDLGVKYGTDSGLDLSMLQPALIPGELQLQCLLK